MSEPQAWVCGSHMTQNVLAVVDAVCECVAQRAHSASCARWSVFDLSVPAVSNRLVSDFDSRRLPGLSHAPARASIVMGELQYV